MARTKHSGDVILVILVIAATYFTWTAFASSHCISEGITNQTRTTWAPTGGCIAVDDYQKPWSAFTRRD